MRSIFLILTALSGIIAVPLPRNSVGSSSSHQHSVLLAKLHERQTEQQPSEQPGYVRGGTGPQSEDRLFRESDTQGTVPTPGNFPPIDYSLFEIKCDEVPYSKVRSLDID